MKRFIGILVFFVLTALILSLAGCAQESGLDVGGVSGVGGYSPTGKSYAPTGDDYIVSDSATEEKASSSETSERDVEAKETGEEIKETEPNEQTKAGLITASAWDDNQYYSAWKKLFEKGQTSKEDGKFSDRTDANNNWGFETLRRVTVTVKNGENAVQGALVSYYDENQKEYAAKTNANGVAYIFPPAEEGTVKVTVGETVKEAAFSAEERDLAVDIESDNAKQNLIKLMLVVDVTGSMGDELRYINNELADVVDRVATQNEGVRIDLALLFYRDEGDAEKFSYSEFTDVTDVQGQGLRTQIQKITAQEATGGGDYEEAVDEALQLAMSKDWGSENSTKIIFHVLDAPPHDEAEYKTRFYNAVSLAAKKGIRLCPILCSGADETCEYVVRNEAIYTGGTFIFVTDHSGIGNAHYDPDLPNAVVEKLNDLMVRVINGHYTGNFASPVWWNAPAEETQQSPTPAEEA